MKKIFLVDESFEEYAKHHELEEDDWDMDDELMGPEKIENVDIDDEIIETDDLVLALNNELNSPEFNRIELDFRLKSTGEKLSGITMAKMASGDTFLFKTQDGLRKINVDDIILESKKSK